MTPPSGPIQLHPPTAHAVGDDDLGSIREGLESLAVLLEREAAARLEREEAAGERAERRHKLVTRYIIPAIVTVVAGGSVGGYQLAALPTDASEKAADRIGDQLDQQEGGDRLRANELDGKVRRLAERSVAQEVLVTESIRYLGDKIDRIAPRHAGAVEKPASLKAAEKRVDAIKREKAVDEIFAETGDAP